MSDFFFFKKSLSKFGAGSFTYKSEIKFHVRTFRINPILISEQDCPIMSKPKHSDKLKAIVTVNNLLKYLSKPWTGF